MLQSATSHYRQSALLARRAAVAAASVSAEDVASLVRIVATNQMAQAVISERATAAMLAEQDIDAEPAARIAPAAFTTSPQMLGQMLATTSDVERLVAGLVQDAGRSAESVAATARPRVGHVRYLSPPSCSRCAVLAGGFYRFSSGFQRHPGCDCVMVPTHEQAAPSLVSDPSALLDKGLVTGMSKADRQALTDGADFNKVVNVRRYSAGLRESGRVLARQGKLTPEGVYRVASSRDEAVSLLRRFGYLR